MLHKQFKTIEPSVPGALYRLLMRQDDVSYLREQNGIIGFELDFKANQSLAGFALIAIKKHTILAYRNEHKEQLIIFPSLEMLFDTSYELLPLRVTKKLYTNDNFDGEIIQKGRLKDVVRDLTPPQKNVEMSDHALRTLQNALNRGEQLVGEITEEFSHDLPDHLDEPEFEEPQFDEPYFEDYDNYQEVDNYEDYTEFMDELESSPADQILNNVFKDMNEIINQAVLLGANKDRLILIQNALMMQAKGASTSVIIKSFQQLVAKAFREGKL